MNIRSLFSRTAHGISDLCGRPATFLLALASIIFWALLGPIFHFSDTWQLVANTTTSLITFLVVFLLQNTQNRDTTALHMKIDELIRAIPPARNTLQGIEQLTEDDLERMRDKPVKSPRRRPVRKGV